VDIAPKGYLLSEVRFQRRRETMPNLPLPPEVVLAFQALRPVFHAASWESFLYLITGLLLGQAQAGIVRASLLAPREYNWRRLHDLLRRNRWDGMALLVCWTGVVLSLLYPQGYPSHLFWVLDGTYLEKRYAQEMDEVMNHYRPHPKAGQSRRLKGHGVLVVAHLYEQMTHRFRALLLGGLLYVKEATWVELGQQLVKALPFPEETHNVIVVDRGLMALKLVKTLEAHQLYALGRVKANASFYLPATEADYKGRGRKPTYGEKFRADAAPLEAMEWSEMSIPVDGKMYDGVVYRGRFLRRGVKNPVDLIRVEVGDWPPWLLMPTDPSLSTEQAIWAYYGRSQIEVAIAEGKALGLDQYRGRRSAGIRRWPMVIGVVHSLLQLMAVGALNVTLPRQGWPWYRKETTVGAIRRRLGEWVLRHHFSHLFPGAQNREEMDHVA
jgi:hypothetical protein